MAGPVLTIYLRPQLTSELAGEISDWIENRLALTNGYELTKQWNGPFPARPNAAPQMWPSWSFQAAVDFPRQASEGQRRPLLFGLAPFGGESGTGSYLSRGWRDFAASNLGFVPGFLAHISCMSKQPEDHRVAGQIALFIAQWLGGSIALDIEFSPAILETLPGNYIYARGAYDAERYGWDFCEIGLADVAFMRAYLDSPNYYLRK